MFWNKHRLSAMNMNCKHKKKYVCVEVPGCRFCAASCPIVEALSLCTAPPVNAGREVDERWCLLFISWRLDSRLESRLSPSLSPGLPRLRRSRLSSMLADCDAIRETEVFTGGSINRPVWPVTIDKFCVSFIAYLWFAFTKFIVVTEWQQANGTMWSWHKISLWLHSSFLLLVQVRLRTEVSSTPSSTRPGFELMTSRSWQYIPCHWDPALTTRPSVTSLML